MIILKEINTSIKQGCIKVIKRDGKDIYKAKNRKEKSWSFELSIPHRTSQNPKKGITVSKKRDIQKG